MDGTTSIELPRLRWTEDRRVQYERTTIGAEWMSAVPVDVRNLFSVRVPRLAIIAVFVLMAFSCALSVAQGGDRSVDQFAHTAWTAKDGAPSVIRAIAQTSDGFLWLGTPTGLYRFDGVHFEFAGPGQDAHFASPSVGSLLALENGDLWVGFVGGVVSRIRDGHRTDYFDVDGDPIGRVLSLAHEQDGTVWVACGSGLIRFDGTRWNRVAESWNFPGKTAAAIYVDHQETLWVATEDTIVYLPHGARSFRKTGIHIGLVDQIAEAPDGKLWMAEVTRSVRPIPVEGSARSSDRTEIRVGAHSILFDRTGALWIGTVGDGLRRVPHAENFKGTPGRFSHDIESFATKDGLSDDFIRSILQDREGNIWVGTTNGLDRFRKTNLVPVSLPVHSQNAVIAADDHGDLWAGEEGLFHVHEGRASTADFHPHFGYVFTASRDLHGDIWLTTPESIARLSGGHVQRIPYPHGINTTNVETVHVAVDHSGALWATAEQSGIFIWNGDTWQPFAIAPKLAKLAPTSSFTDGSGRVWFGYSDGTVLMIDAKRRIPSIFEKGSEVGTVRAIQGLDQDIWVGGDFGLALFDGQRFRKLTPADSPAFGSISGIQQTADGSLWLAESRGVIHIGKTEIEKTSRDAAHRMEYELYDSTEGLPGSFQNVVRDNRVVEATDGKVWFSTTMDLAWIDPSRIERNTVAPPVSLQAVEADGKRYTPSANLVLPARTMKLQISYSALSLSGPERVLFRYKLENIDKGWESVGVRRDAVYTNLDPGKYRFRVIACNNDGVWNLDGATLNFSIQPAWYQELWFKLLCVAVAAVGVIAVYRWRVRRVSAIMSARYDERLSERTRLARELHDTFLQSVQGSKLVVDLALGEESDSALIRKSLEKLSMWLDRAVVEGRAALQSLRDPTGETDHLLVCIKEAFEDGRVPSSMTATLTVSGDARPLHPVACDEVCQMINEAIRNACLHSLGSQLLVNVRFGRDLVVRVRDNGVGIAIATIKEGKKGHFGLRGIRERGDRIRGNVSIQRPADGGTEVTITIPGSIIYHNNASSHSL